MSRELPFDSIESAHEFVGLLANAVLQSKRDIDTDVQREMGLNFRRRLEALQIVGYKLEALESHLTKSRRILNDLRSLRRLLFDERASGALAVRPTSTGIAKTETPPSPSPEVSRSGGGSESPVARQASICATARKRAISSPRDAHASNVKAADAVPWYATRTSGLSTKEKSRETNQIFAQHR
jgi:hypothetical protein